jgi:type IV secretion system protein TrbL
MGSRAVSWFAAPLAACSPINPLCKIGQAVVASAFQQVVDAMSDAAGQVLKTLMTFWVHSDLPNLASPGGVTFWVNAHLSWLVSAAAVFSVLVGAARVGFTRRPDAGYDTLRMLLRTCVTAAVAVPVVALLAAAGDAFANWILDAASVTNLATVNLTALAPGVTLIGSLLIVLTSLFQMAIMVMRGAVVAILVGTLPLAAATTNTATGKQWFAKLCGWTGAFLLVKPVAALIYAAGLQLESQTSASGQLSGMFILLIAVFALPVLIKLLVPAAAAAGGSGGGSLVLAAAGAAATGAVVLSGAGAGAAAAGGGARGLGTSIPPSPTGSSPGGGPGPASGGPSGIPAGSGGGGPAGSGPAAAGAGSAAADGSGSVPDRRPAPGGGGGSRPGGSPAAGPAADAGAVTAETASPVGPPSTGSAATASPAAGSPPTGTPSVGAGSTAAATPAGPPTTAGGGAGGGPSGAAGAGSASRVARANPWVVSARRVVANAQTAAEQASGPNSGGVA